MKKAAGFAEPLAALLTLQENKRQVLSKRISKSPSQYHKQSSRRGLKSQQYSGFPTNWVLQMDGASLGFRVRVSEEIVGLLQKSQQFHPVSTGFYYLPRVKL